MTVAQSDLAPAPSIWSAIRRVPLGPVEGWLTYFLVTVLAATVALSLDDAAWVLGNQTYGDFYIWASSLGVLFGFIGAKVGWSRWVAHLVGAAAAALILPLFVGGVLLPDGGSLRDLYDATAASVVRAWVDLAIHNDPVTQQIGHYLLVMSVICWSVGQFVASAVFRHRRPLDAVIVAGLILIANMALTIRDQLSLLVIFSTAALAILARTHAFEEQAAWLRRRIGDASTVRSLYLRGGTAFIVLAVFGSLALTTSASSAPLASAWDGVSPWLVEHSQDLQRLLPFGGAARPTGVGFGPTAPISGSWSTGSTLELTAQLPAGDKTPYYWRVIAYDKFTRTAWSQTRTRTVDVPAGTPPLAGQGEDPSKLGPRRELAYSVVNGAMPGRYVVSPSDAGAVDKPTRLDVVGLDGYFASLQLAGGTKAYSGTALVPLVGDKDNGRTEHQLEAAGRNYPPDVQLLYLDKGPDGTFGPYAAQLLDELSALNNSDNPYVIARTMEQYFRSDAFHYSADVTSLPCRDVSVVECFAHYREGYCQYYASTMAMLLRERGIPSRVVEGFLPGARDETTGEELVYATSAHMWVEVYFPGWGWQVFDPTGGGLAQTEPLVPGRSIAPSAVPSLNLPSGDGNDNGGADPTQRRGGFTGAPSDGSSGPSAGLLVAVAIVLLLGLGALVFAAWTRGPRGDVSPDGVWRSVSRLAGRFGFGPRPTQTVYEYAGSLGDVMPALRPELQTVARAKVEVSYGRRVLGEDRLRSLAEAQRRLRVALIRLVFRRGDRRRLRRR